MQYLILKVSLMLKTYLVDKNVAVVLYRKKLISKVSFYLIWSLVRILILPVVYFDFFNEGICTANVQKYLLKLREIYSVQ